MSGEKTYRVVLPIEWVYRAECEYRVRYLGSFVQAWFLSLEGPEMAAWLGVRDIGMIVPVGPNFGTMVGNGWIDIVPGSEVRAICGFNNELGIDIRHEVNQARARFDLENKKMEVEEVSIGMTVVELDGSRFGSLKMPRPKFGVLDKVRIEEKSPYWKVCVPSTKCTDPLIVRSITCDSQKVVYNLGTVEQDMYSNVPEQWLTLVERAGVRRVVLEPTEAPEVTWPLLIQLGACAPSMKELAKLLPHDMKMPKEVFMAWLQDHGRDTDARWVQDRVKGKAQEGCVYVEDTDPQRIYAFSAGGQVYFLITDMCLASTDTPQRWSFRSMGSTTGTFNNYYGTLPEVLKLALKSLAAGACSSVQKVTPLVEFTDQRLFLEWALGVSKA